MAHPQKPLPSSGMFARTRHTASAPQRTRTLWGSLPSTLPSPPSPFPPMSHLTLLLCSHPNSGSSLRFSNPSHPQPPITIPCHRAPFGPPQFPRELLAPCFLQLHAPSPSFLPGSPCSLCPHLVGNSCFDLAPSVKAPGTALALISLAMLTVSCRRTAYSSWQEGPPSPSIPGEGSSTSSRPSVWR